MKTLVILACHAAKSIQSFLTSMTEVRNCYSGDTCACNSHDNNFTRVEFEAEEVVELRGEGCVSDTCACNSHPRGFTGRTLYRLASGQWLVLKGATHSQDTGHKPDLMLCDPLEERIEMSELSDAHDFGVAEAMYVAGMSNEEPGAKEDYVSQRTLDLILLQKGVNSAPLTTTLENACRA